MSTDSAAPYELHLLETPTLQSERYLWHDPVQAVLGYNRLALEARRPAVLTKGRTLEGEAAEIIATYSPSEDAPPIKVRLGKAEPAFPREQRESEAEENLREDREDRMHAASWYAKGFIDCIGGLSPFDYEDAAAFAEWHVDTSYGGACYPIDEQWATWSAQRRQEKGL